jgi:hypothetical protein
MYLLRKINLVVCVLCAAALPAFAQQNADLPDAPTPQFQLASLTPSEMSTTGPADSSNPNAQTTDTTAKTLPGDDGSIHRPKCTPQDPCSTGEQPKRILGLMPNFRTVSAGAHPPPPTIKQNFRVATHQAFDYSSFVFLAITSGIADAEDAHPSLDTYNGGNAVLWAYTWRGFLDKTDGNYLAAFILPTILHEDTRYYAQGQGSKWRRLGYASSRIILARTYGGRTTVNLAGLGGKVAAQAISPYYYPPGSSPFGVLATKFGYACARDIGFTVFREFYPDMAIHFLHRHP